MSRIKGCKNNMDEECTTKCYNGSGNFPERLHYVLEEMARDNQERIMCWDECGSGFKVHDRKLLETEILPTWFRQTKYTSFQRQLNIYGFTRINKGPKKGTYFHELFLRSMPELTQKIPRKDIKKGSHARRLNTIASEDIPRSQESPSNRISAEPIRSNQGVPVDYSLSSISRSSFNTSSIYNAPCYVNVSHASASCFGSARVIPVSARHIGSNYSESNSFLEQEFINRALHGSDLSSTSTKAGELINRALALARSDQIGQGVTSVHPR